MGGPAMSAQIAPPKDGAGAYVAPSIESEVTDYVLFELSKPVDVNTGQIVHIPSSSRLLTERIDMETVVYYLSHEVTHEYQFQMASEYIHGNQTLMGGVFLSTIGTMASQVSHGVYKIQPTEAHAYAVCEKIVHDLGVGGFFSE